MEKLNEAYKENFQTLVRAAKNGDLAVMSSKIAATGEDVAVLAIVTREGGQYCVIPMGHLCPDNPYEYYVDPTS